MWCRAVGFMVTLTLSMLVAPCAAAPPAHIPTVGWLDQGGWADKAHLHAVFLQGLRELDYEEEHNLVLVHRDMEGQPARLPALAAELVRLQVDVIVTAGGGPATRAAMQATTTIPIVMAESEEPAGTGLFASPPPPGGNVTGLSTLGPDAMGKRLHLLKDAAPWVIQVAVLYHPPTAATVVGLWEAQVAAPEVGLTVLPMAVSTPDEVDAQLASLRQVGADAVLTTAGAFAGVPHRRLLDGAARHQLPTMCAERSAAE